MTPQTYEYRLLDLLEEYPELIVMTAENRGALRNFPNHAGERFIDVGIAEMTMVGAAAGMATRGRQPIIHALATFLVYRAYEFVRTDVGISGAPVTLMGAVPGFLSTANGPTHQAIEDVALMRNIPGMQVVCPTDNDELLACIPAILASKRPTYVRFYDGPAKVAHDFAKHPYTLGKAEPLRQVAGERATILSYGFLVEHVMGAAEKLAAKGIETNVLNMRSVEPLDREAILAAAKSSGNLVVIEDHFKRGGLYTAVAETLVEAGQLAKVTPITLEDKWFVPAQLPDVLKTEGFDSDSLAARIETALAAN